MKSFIQSILAILPCLSLIALFNATPINARMNQKRGHSRFSVDEDGNLLSKRNTPSRYLAPAPHWVAYTFSDYSKTQALPTGSELVGYNVFIMSFWLSNNTGATYKAAEFAKLGQSTRDWIVNDYHAHNISFLVSAFGYGDNPTSNGENPVTVANNLAAFVKKYDLDGVDIDYEDFNAFFNDNGTLPVGGKLVNITAPEKWLADFTVALRKQLPVGEYILTHAPVAPWFTTNVTRYPGGAYRTVQKTVGSLIDWYNVQFYNQGSDYITCPSLLTRSLAHEFPNSSLFEIAKLSGVPLEKLVIGKPATTADAASGWMNLTTLSGCLAQAKKSGWNAGAMLWQYPNANASAIKTVRGSAFPV